MSDTLGDAFVRILPELTEFKAALQTGLLAAATQAGDTLSSAIGDALGASSGIADGFDSTLEQMEDSAKGSGAAIADQLSLAFEGISSEAKEAESVVDSKFEQMEDSAKASGNTIESALKTSFNTIESVAKSTGSTISSTFDKATDSIKGSFSGISDGFREIGIEVLANIATQITAQIGQAFKAITVGAVQAAADLGEAVNLIGLVFTENEQAALDFGQAAVTTLGLAEGAANQFSAALGGQLKNLGFTEDAAFSLSKQLLTLGADLASAFNTEPVEAIQAIQAALRGETETIEKFNVFLTAEAVAQKAVDLGLAEGVGAVDAYGKAQATLALILEQTTDVQGDFANTASSLPNLLRTLSAEFESLQATAGQPALAVLSGVVQDLLGVMEAGRPEVEAFGQGFADFIEGVAPAFLDFVEAGLDNLPRFGQALADSAPAMSKLVDVATSFIPVFANIAELIGALPPDLIAVAIQTSLFSKAFGQAGTSIALAAGPLGAMIPLLTSVTELVGGLPAPLLSAGIQFAALQRSLSGFATGTGGLGDMISKLATPIALLTAAVSLWQSTMAKAQATGEGIGEPVAASIEEAADSYEEMVAVSARLDEGIIQLTEDLAGSSSLLDSDWRKAHEAAIATLESFDGPLEQTIFNLDLLSSQYGIGQQAVLDFALANEIDLSGSLDDVKLAFDEAGLATSEFGADSAAAAGQLSQLESAIAGLKDVTIDPTARATWLEAIIALDPAAAVGSANEIATAFGLTKEQVENALTDAAAAVDAFEKDIEAAIPTFKSIFTSLVPEEQTATDFQAALDARAEDLRQFTEDLRIIAETNKGLALEIAGLGVEGGGGIASELAGDPSKIADVVTAFGGLQTASQEYLDFMTGTFSPGVAGAVLDAQLPLDQFAANLPEAIGVANQALIDLGAAIGGEAGDAMIALGNQLGSTVGTGMSEGLEEKQALIEGTALFIAAGIGAQDLTAFGLAPGGTLGTGISGGLEAQKMLLVDTVSRLGFDMSEVNLTDDGVNPSITFADGMKVTLDTQTGEVVVAVEGVGSAMSEVDLAEEGAVPGGTFIQGLGDKVATTDLNPFLDVLSNTLSLFDLSDEGETAGSSYGTGFAGGLLSAIDAIIAAANEAAAAAPDTFGFVLSLTSPSKVAEAQGLNFGKGFALGLLDAVNLVSDAAGVLANSGLAAISDLDSSLSFIGAQGSKQGLVRDIIINNPEPERASESIPRQLRNLAFLMGGS